MHHTTIKGLVALMNNKAKSAAMLTGTMLAVSPAFAFAADFDGTEVISKIVTYTGVGVAILGAFALGRWTLRALGIIGGK
ncbi:hypothetical protein [Stenotrophomonas indicatrix]|uniref:hypothetical protein n=1 Tax=Stenotrophomonas indicatrix TaxID=2045451 RepID=UPI001CBCFCC4|nr:hypothetical protein [Stenotrophomonas indicatrix]